MRYSKALPEIVMFSPLPPIPNGISDYTFEILQLLEKKVELTVVVNDGVFSAQAPGGVKVLSVSEYELDNGRFSSAIHVYQIGNNPDHLYMLPILAQTPRIIVLHDPSLHHLLDCATLADGDFTGYTGALEGEYGVAGRTLGEQFQRHRLRDQFMFFELPMIGALVGPARGVVVHSFYAATKVIARVPDARVTVIPHQYSPPAIDRVLPPSEVRQRLGVNSVDILFMSLGFVTKSKRIPDTLRALAAIKDQLPPFRYVIAGELRPEEVDLALLVSELGLDGVVTLLGYVDEADFFSLIGASDIVINLRYPIGGETSGSMIRALGGGACIVVVDKGPFGELPDGIACKVPWGSGFEDRLAALLLRLVHDPAERQRIGSAAKAFVADTHSLEATVAGYITAISDAVDQPVKPWRSSVAWEALPPSDLAQAIKKASLGKANDRLPLWFRAGTVLLCQAPCAAASWGDAPRERELLAYLGHRPQSRTLAQLLDGDAEDTDAPRTLDLAVVFATTVKLAGDVAFPARLNRALGFGGVLVINVDAASADPLHPLQSRERGTGWLKSFGFRVDLVTVVAPSSLEDGLASALPPPFNERCWRAVKVSEFRTEWPRPPASARAMAVKS